ncbi:MAG: hypothetical protein H7Y11_03535 [Armatimonadetes bacterium]|nr:hypothetical protein [Anaerolineae bacterium]
MSSTTASPKPSTLIKPTLDTKYHIDYDWWQHTPGEDLRVYLLSHLPSEQFARLSQMQGDQMVDYIDPVTGEVFQLDALGLALKLAADDPNFISDDISLVDGVFRVLLRNNNQPTSSHELEQQTRRPAKTILKMLSGERIYKGIRPYHE